MHPFFSSSHGFAFMVASELKADTSKFFENIEDVIAQADELDDKFVQVSRIWVIFRSDSQSLLESVSCNLKHNET